jgi:hypothetical protein
VLAVLASAGTAAAAPAEVRLRVEGRSTTLFEGTVMSDARPLDGRDGSGPHQCGSWAPTPITALSDAGLEWSGSWNEDFRDFFLDRIGPDASNDTEALYWAVLTDWRYAVGGCRSEVRPGGEVLWAYGADARPLLLRLSGPARAHVGETITMTVRDGRVRPATGADGGPVAGAVSAGAVTDAGGHARVSFESAGLRVLKAEHPNGIRSNALAVCVGDALCQHAPLAPLGPVPGGRPTIAKIRPGERFARGAAPRVLRGTAPGPSAAIALSGSNGAVRLSDTVQVVNGSWRRVLPRELPPGRYTLSAAGAVVSFSVAAHPRSRVAAVRAATRWLLRARNRVGGFGSAPGAPSSPLFTGWAATALGRATAGPRTAPVLSSARRLLRSPAFSPRTLADLERSVLALAGSEHAADRRAARRWRRAIARRQRQDGSFAGDVNLTAYAVLALGRGHRDERQRARRWLRAHPRDDIDSTGAALWALAGSVTRAERRRVRARLRGAQGPDGGFGVLPGDDPNAQSTALAILGMHAAGLRPGRMRTEDGISPLDYLRARTGSSGAVAYDWLSRRTPVWVTAQALLALARARSD